MTFFQQISELLPPLRGIIHAAMVLADRPALEKDEQSWAQVLAPKMLGAWHLHRHSYGLPLDFFVLYSSMSALIGNAAQGNYVAGNAFLEALARARRAHGLPALALSWGAMAEIGYVAREKTTLDYLDRIGMRAVDPQQALAQLGKLVQTSRPMWS